MLDSIPAQNRVYLRKMDPIPLDDVTASIIERAKVLLPEIQKMSKIHGPYYVIEHPADFVSSAISGAIYARTNELRQIYVERIMRVLNEVAAKEGRHVQEDRR